MTWSLDTPITADAFHDLRRWILERLARRLPYREAAYHSAMSAIFWRMVRFGVEDTLNSYPARDILNLIVFARPDNALPLLNAAYARAIAEADADILERLGREACLQHFVNWHRSWQSIAPGAAEKALAQETDLEARGMAKVVMARHQPQLVAPGWLQRSDLPPPPAIAHALCRAVIPACPDLAATVVGLLDDRAILFAMDPDPLLADLVRIHPLPPQALLDSFAGCYGEGTLVAAAEWHLEHEGPRAACALADRVRTLSDHHPRAALVRCLARRELADRSGARACLRSILDPDLIRSGLIKLAEAGEDWVGDDELITALEECTGDKAETLHAGLLVLLRRGRLEASRRLVARHADRFAGHPVLDQVFELIRKNG